MRSTKRDYTNMTKVAAELGLEPYSDRIGNVVRGFYTLEGLNAPIDLTASAENDVAILKNALRQLSEQVDESYHRMIEGDLRS
jgi:hypothetical protein